MWIVYAFGSAFFAGVTAILAKVGLRSTDSHLATALRTIVVLLFSWAIVWFTGADKGLPYISAKSFCFLFLSALTTGGSWICYFRALQLGDVNKVVPVDKASLLLTMLLAFVLLGEAITPVTLPGMAAIAVGTYWMIQKKERVVSSTKTKPAWLLWAAGSAVFASLTAILAKIGIEDVDSNLATALRTLVVLAMAWLLVFVQKKQTQIKLIDRRSWLFLLLSGLATGLSWLCYYKALHDGQASIVVPIDKLSILITAAFSFLWLGEKLSRKACAGLGLITIGTLALLF